MPGQISAERDLSLRSTDRQGHPAWTRSHNLAVFETERLFPSLFPQLSFTILIHGGSRNHFPAHGTLVYSEYGSVIADNVQLAQLWRLMALRRDADELMAHWQL